MVGARGLGKATNSRHYGERRVNEAGRSPRRVRKATGDDDDVSGVRLPFTRRSFMYETGLVHSRRNRRSEGRAMIRAVRGGGLVANSRRVLIVDGYEQVRDLLLNVFTFEHFEVDATADADLARCRLSQGRYDLALLDLDLQDGEGHRLCNWAVTSTAVPIIAMSAYADELAVVTALDSGVSDFVRKPFRKRELVARARAQLRWRGCQAASDAEIIDFDNVRVD